MISRVEIENFGIYKNATFDFSPGLNLIRGENRSGKTWLLRALAAVLFNWGAFNTDDALDEVRYEDPNGKKASYYRVRVTFADGAWVERYRNKSTNKYIICPAGGIPQEHTSVGRGFYKPVAEVSGLFPVSLDGREETTPNVKLPEDDRFFILGQSPHTQDAILTRLVGVDVIEQAASDTESDRRRLVTEISRLTEEIADTSDELSQYDNLPRLITKLKDASVLLNGWTDLAKRASDGRQMLQERTRLIAADASIKKRHSALFGATDAIADVLEKLLPLAKRVKDGTEGLIRRNHLLVMVEKTAKALASLDALPVCRSALAGAEAVGKQVVDAKKMLALRNTLKQSLTNISAQLVRGQKNIEEARARRKQILAEAGICPLCGQEIKGDRG